MSFWFNHLMDVVENVTETVAETTGAADIEAVTETVTESISYEAYDLTAKVAGSKVVIGIIGIVLLFAAIIFAILLIRKKHKGSGLGILGGIATYLIFYYFAVSVAAALLFTYSPLKTYVGKVNGRSEITSTGVYILVYMMITTLLPVLGRWACNKTFTYKLNTFGQNFAFGQGIACTQAVFTISTLFQMVASMIIINRGGIETVLSGVTTQADADAMYNNVMDLINYKTESMVFLVLVALLLVVYQLAITVPFYALYQKKLKGQWYLAIIGSYLVIQALQYMNDREIIPTFVQFVITLAVVASTVYLCIKLYVKLYKSEERDVKKDKEEALKKKLAQSQSQKKMPRFGDLSKL